MAETKSDPKPSDPQTQPPPPPCSATPAARSSKKRKLDNVDTHRKLRALVKSLRPHFIDVLRTPDFRNSQAAHEIRKKLKRAMDAYKQMKPETASAEMPPKKQSEGQSLPGEPKDGQKNIEEKQAKRHQSERVPEKSPEPPLDVKAEDSKLPESYVVGGSNLGWNFILFSGASTKAVYYGVTKESHLISRAKKSNALK